MNQQQLRFNIGIFGFKKSSVRDPLSTPLFCTQKNMKTSAFLLLFVLLVSANTSIAQTAAAPAATSKEFTLKQAQDFAVENSYSTKSAMLDEKKAVQRVRETTAIGLPQINASAGFQNFLDVPTQVLPDFISPVVVGTLVQNGLLPQSALDNMPENYIAAQFGTKYNMSFGASVSQLIFDGSYIVGLKAASAYVQLSTVQVEKSEIEIKNAVAQAYATVLIAQENAKILKQTKTNLNKTLEETKALLENGFVEESDVDQLVLNTLNLDNSIMAAERQIDVAFNLLKFQMGMPVNDIIALTETLENIIPTSEIANKLAATEANPTAHIDYKILDVNKNLMQLAMRNEQAKLLPSLAGSFSAQRNALGNEFNFFGKDGQWYPNTMWGLSLNVPIFSSGMRYYKIQQAKVDYEKATIQQQQVEQSIIMQTIKAKADFSVAIDQLSNDKQNLELAEKIHGKTTIKYKAGMVSSFELTQADNQLLNAQGKYIGSMFNLIDTKLTLDKLLSNN